MFSLKVPIVAAASLRSALFWGQDPPCSSWRKEKVYFSMSRGCGAAAGRPQHLQRAGTVWLAPPAMEGRTPLSWKWEEGSGLAVLVEVGVKGRMGVSCPHVGPRRPGWQTLWGWNAGLQPAWAHLRLASWPLPDSHPCGCPAPGQEGGPPSPQAFPSLWRAKGW